ncbi:MAG TPA: hypothetical protein VMZ28_19375 [Kofleriaceae bacterium]|nr:hypothetical protein [Kofleriaceae bacterium]
MTIRLCVALAITLTAAACGSSQNAPATAPGVAAAFDPAASDPKAVAVADKVYAAAGGAAWEKVKQIRWTEEVTNDGAPVASGEQAWDRWGGRHHGRLNTPQGEIVVMHELYGDARSAFVNDDKMPEDDRDRAVASALERFRFDTAGLCLQFLLKAPGVKLGYGGEKNDDAGNPTLEEIKVTFDPKDTARDGTTWYAVVDKATSVITRIELVQPGKPDTARIGYAPSDWVTVDGMKFPTKLQNIGMKSEVILFKDIKVGDPEEDLYVPQVQ